MLQKPRITPQAPIQPRDTDLLTPERWMPTLRTLKLF